MVTENHYRWDFIGLSTDEKPTPATSEKVVDGSTYYTSDDSKLYVFCKDQWYEKIPIGGGGGGGDEPAGDGKIEAYNPETGEITGSGFGSTAGNVYMLDRDTHSYIEQPVDNWTSTKITLTTPLDLEHLEGTTSIVAVKPDGTWSTKFVVYGDIDVEGTTAKVYYRKSDGTVGTASPANINNLAFAAASGAFSDATDSSIVVYSCDILGVQFGKDYALTSIPQNFLRYCHNLDQPIVTPNTATTINANFMSYCSRFNSPVILSSNVTSIGEGFLQYDFMFNQPLTLPNSLTTMGSLFLYSCASFNQPIVIPNSVTTMNGSLLNSCYAFNSPITFSSGVKSMPTILNSAYSFNQPLTIPEGVENIGNDWLGYNKVFNSPITLPTTLKTIGNNFLAYGSGCVQFNQPLTLPEGLTSIGNNFLSNCKSFDQPLTLPSTLTSIGNFFLYNCTGFYHTLTVPSSVTSIGTNFMYCQYQLRNLVVESSNPPTDIGSLSMDANWAAAYQDGITLTGAGASAWKTALPDRTANPYRKLIDGTTE